MKEGGLVKKLKLKFEKKICKDGRRNTENRKQKNYSFFKIDFKNFLKKANISEGAVFRVFVFYSRSG